MKFVICTKFQVNRTNCVESRRGGVRLTPPPLKASFNYFFWKASRVNFDKKGGLDLRQRGNSKIWVCFIVRYQKIIKPAGEKEIVMNQM